MQKKKTRKLCFNFYTNLGSEASIKTLFYRYKQQIHV